MKSILVTEKKIENFPFKITGHSAQYSIINSTSAHFLPDL